MSDPLQRPTPEHSDGAREKRLYEIRREAESKGRVEAIGIRPPGAPFPVASPETGYYGMPLLKQAPWKWEIPVYFFVGGAAGSAAMVGAAAHWIGKDEKLARDCRYIAAIGAIASSALLISDLGRPARFLAMLRVFKAQSPMSVGAWTLTMFGTFSGAAAAAELLKERLNIPGLKVAGNISEALAALAGLPLASYTGVLIGASVIPAWNANASNLPVHFAMSGLNSGVGILELMGHEHPALNTLGMGAAAIEVLEGHHLETCNEHAVQPLKRGHSGLITRIGGVLSGPLPLAMRVLAAFAGKQNSRKLRRTAAICSTVGSLITRAAWLNAGRVSAQDWRLPLQLDHAHHRPVVQMQEHAEMREEQAPPGDAGAKKS